MDKPTLPSAYTEQISSLLGAETTAFLESYRQPRAQGLRINPMKSTPKLRESIINQWNLEAVPWCSEGYYYEEPHRPGKHPYHTAGLYYIQEPSAMSAVELLDPRPGETILDMAAAPGGKTTHIASKLRGQGLIVSNEIHAGRAKILAENVERMGLRNVIVTNSTPAGLSERFPACFDRIMLDAPCSGEGMFRKDPDAVREWSPELVAMCVSRQQDILKDVHKLLKPGGWLAYSTCTFNTAENEDVMAWLTSEFPDMSLVQTERIWPHLQKGEGHFVALLRKDDSETNTGKGKTNRKRPSRELDQAWEGFNVWRKSALPGYAPGPGRPLLFGDSLYWLPENNGFAIHDEQMTGLKIPRAGLHLGEWKKNRFEPAHALALASKPDEAGGVFNASAESEEVRSFLRGEMLNVDPTLKGWILVTADGLPIGWGKASSGQLKNHLPKGLRQHL
ncbi:RsmF rRNA methyltransferase first C-terminal domain-containing protein [Paenibacillus sp. P96]|uniref:RsmF rRNA methyltransferase first C-terminal domain-containing protein n=1 Tax=Paenibacillus zeirhizosphaerae TaxID=2987519 RepID=A0ABT9FSK7_9BACL|nr:RsmF rRNA methyltransferase first C-terminal domain-containing protein [Paenibacillus sp. P96]MDP4097712.1 RsmF rRNA methyltransferase first C-terminal domain-containing protein [Paenibacillus sp. P96]